QPGRAPRRDGRRDSSRSSAWGEELFELRHLLGGSDADDDVTRLEHGARVGCHVEGSVVLPDRDDEGPGRLADAQVPDGTAAGIAVTRDDDLLEAELRDLAAGSRGDVEEGGDLRLEDDVRHLQAR